MWDSTWYRSQARRQPAFFNSLQAAPPEAGNETPQDCCTRRVLAEAETTGAHGPLQRQHSDLANRIRFAHGTLRPPRAGHHLADGHRWTPRQHVPDSRPARRANENRLTRVRIDQAPAPGRLNDVETHGVIPGGSVRRPRNRSTTGSRPCPDRLAPRDAKVGEAMTGERGLDGNEHEEHDRYPETKGLELGPRGAARQ